MKKLVILSLFLIVLSATLFGASARVFNQQIVLAGEPDNPDDILNHVTNTGTTTSPNYILRVTANGETKGTDLGQTGQNMRVYQNTLSGQLRAIANFNQTLWTNNWAVGTPLVIDIWWTQTPAGQGDGYEPYPQYKHAQKIWTVVSGSVVSQIDANAMIVPPPYVPAADETLTITSNPTGQPILAGGVPTGEVTPFDIVNPVEGTVYTIGNPLYTWAPLSYTVPADFETATVNFVGTEIDTYTYKLYVTGPDGYVVTHATPANGGTTDYVAIGENEAALLGAYTIAAAPAGYEWQVNPIEVVAGGWTLVPPTKGSIGGRSTGAKANFVYEKTIEFVLVEIPVNEIIVDEDGTVVVGPIGTVITPSVPVPAILPGVDTGIPAVTYQITATGVRDVTVTRPAGYPVAWWAYLVVGGNLIEAPNPIITPTYTFVGVDFDAKGDVVVIIDDNMTLPVVLSQFAAVLTAQNYVQLSWVTESETNMLGFRVYRSETAEMADATLITPVMIGATNTSSTQHYSVTDNEVVVGTTYNYWLEAVDMGSSTFHGPQAVTVTGNSTPTLPTITTLGNAYPNPFRASTNISLAVKEGENATVTIYNILGQVVRTYTKSAGNHTINWDGRDVRGNACGSGIYFYKLSSPSMNQTKKMVIVK